MKTNEKESMMQLEAQRKIETNELHLYDWGV